MAGYFMVNRLVTHDKGKKNKSVTHLELATIMCDVKHDLIYKKRLETFFNIEPTKIRLMLNVV
tara:strand:- start:330 stop:518 length:189 start_codon:yes stop_codon:yes gene_type:complete